MNWKSKIDQNECGNGCLLFLRASGGDDHGNVGLQAVKNALRQPHVGLTHVATLRLGETKTIMGYKGKKLRGHSTKVGERECVDHAKCLHHLESIYNDNSTATRESGPSSL